MSSAAPIDDVLVVGIPKRAPQPFATANISLMTSASADGCYATFARDGSDLIFLHYMTAIFAYYKNVAQ
jgi:hypothetical protein